MKNEIIKGINSISGKYSTYEVFADWVKLQALSISQAVWYLEEREQEYKDIARKYSEKDLQVMSEMSGMLTLAFEEGMSDVLGSIYMSKEMGSNKLGQFFTPYHICQLMAKLQDMKDIEEHGYIKVIEPSTGAGGNIIAFCEHVKNSGYNYQTQVNVVAQDLDYKAVYMSYVQYALLGIPAVVVQGDTLNKCYSGGFDKNVFITPTYMLHNHFNKKGKCVKRDNNKWVTSENVEDNVQINLLDYIGR